MNKSPFIIGVAGGTGSGKTTVTAAIVRSLNNLDVVVVQHDSYYRDNSQLTLPKREKINYDHPDALETALLVRHLKQLKSGKKTKIPAYDFSTHTRKNKVMVVRPAKAVIVEGILIYTDHKLRELIDMKIFVDTDDDLRFIRRLRRDIQERNRSIESVIEQYMKTVRPMHIEFVEPSRRYADIIIPEGHNPVAINMVVSMIRERMLSGVIKIDGKKQRRKY